MCRFIVILYLFNISSMQAAGLVVAVHFWDRLNDWLSC
jgi:hypothetical protein